MKPYPDAEFNDFMDRMKQGSKGKRIQDRVESSLKGFHDAFTGNSEKWMKFGNNWPEVLTLLRILHRSVNAYYSRLFNQMNRQV